jgi:glutamate-1-semialdehyde 2,1-aminomutase
MGKYSKRLHAVIPGGAHTYSRGDDQFPANAPEILESGYGAYVETPEKKKYLDYGMGLRAVTLGYAYPTVVEAAFSAISKGVNLTRPSTIELKAAELLVDLIPSVEMVKFAKNGSNVTTAAMKLSRAATGKQYVCVPKQQPFFSFDDWFIGSTVVKRGVNMSSAQFTLNFDYGNISSLEKIFDQYEGEIAAVMLEPATTISPCPDVCKQRSSEDRMAGCRECPNHDRNFLVKVQNLCRQKNALFILDEMITGFRWRIDGAQSFYGVTPDLTTFGKGMANGFSLAALSGKREYMNLGGITQTGMERTFLLSSTHGSEMPSLAAFIEVVNVYKRENVVDHLWGYGRKLKDGINKISNDYGLSEYFYVEGLDISMNYVAKNQCKEISAEYRTLFAQEMIKNGVLMPWIANSYAHKEQELEITLSAVSNSLKIYKQALERGAGIYLSGPTIKPVFRKLN